MLSGKRKLNTTNSLNVIVTNMNAKNEFIEHTKYANSPIKCASIQQMDIYTHKIIRVINLFENYSPEDMDTFLNELNFDYNDGYGGQTLFGTIWYMNGQWSSRSEYDGSEWWDHQQCPNISFYSPAEIDLSGEPNEFTYWDGDESDRIEY
jgi:hypothetical protein